MPELLAERDAYKQADLDALAMRFRARARLGRGVARERRKGATQPEIAEQLDVTVEQVRRYEAAYRLWLKENEGTEP
jgi:Homeodomain-like domain